MTYIPRVVCGSCGQNMRCLTNEVAARATTAGAPYYIVQCDRWGCPKCDHEVLVGFASRPTHRASDPDFGARPYDTTIELEMP